MSHKNGKLTEVCTLYDDMKRLKTLPPKWKDTFKYMEYEEEKGNMLDLHAVSKDCNLLDLLVSQSNNT